MFGREKANIDLALEPSLEWLALYSSQVGGYILNNTVLVDLANNIIGFKDNGCRKSYWYKNNSTGTITAVKNNTENNTGAIWIIGNNKKAYKINGKFKYNNDLKLEYYSAFLKFLKDKNENNLINNLNKLGL